MVPQRIAVLMDGGYVIRRMEGANGRFPDAEGVRRLAISCCGRAEGRSLYRVFFYHGRPYSGPKVAKRPLDGRKVAIGSNAMARRHRQLLTDLARSEDFAVRCGDTVVRGWRLGGAAQRRLRTIPGYRVAGRDFVVDVIQKGVDMRIGLDIAALALKRLVETIVLVTGDADMVPAMRFARREGLRVGVCTLGFHGAPGPLITDADFVMDGQSGSGS